MGNTGGRLICQRGPDSGNNSGNNNKIIPNFTRAKCNEARLNTNTGRSKRIPVLQSLRPIRSNVGRIRWAKTDIRIADTLKRET
eukprot:6182869-Pleurochrysis_carterae.AAC.1